MNGEVAGNVNDFGTCLFSNGQLCRGVGNPDTAVVSSGGYNDGRPHVLVFKRVRSTGAISLYMDGLLAGTALASTASLTAPPRLTLGAQQTDGYYLSGDIAETQLYNSALSEADQQSLEATLFLKYGVSHGPRILALGWGPGDPVYQGATVDFGVTAQGVGSPPIWPSLDGCPWGQTFPPRHRLSGRTRIRPSFRNASTACG